MASPDLKYVHLKEADEFADFQSDLVVYHDDVGDYATNEPTMDGTATLIYYLAGMENEGKTQKRKKYEYNHGAIIRGEVFFYKDIPRDHPQTRYRLWISPNGNILGFNRTIPDTMKIVSITKEEALSSAESYIVKKTDIDINITKVSRNNHIIQEINHKPAVQELHNIFNWPEGFLDEKTMLNKILYYPISPKWHNHERPTVMPFILKDSIMTSCLIEKGNTSVLRVSGNNLVNAIQNNLNSFIGLNPKFCICSSCMTILQTLGSNVEIFREEMLKYFNDTPFLMFYCAGEGTYSPKNDINYANMSFNFAIFGENIISN